MWQTRCTACQFDSSLLQESPQDTVPLLTPCKCSPMLSTRTPMYVLRPQQLYAPRKSVCDLSLRIATAPAAFNWAHQEIELQVNYNQTEHASSIKTYDGWRLHVRYIFFFSFFRSTFASALLWLIYPLNFSYWIISKSRERPEEDGRKMWKNNEK